MLWIIVALLILAATAALVYAIREVNKERGQLSLLAAIVLSIAAFVLGLLASKKPPEGPGPIPPKPPTGNTNPAGIVPVPPVLAPDPVEVLGADKEAAKTDQQLKEIDHAEHTPENDATSDHSLYGGVFRDRANHRTGGNS